MAVKRPVEGQRRAAQPGERRIQHALADQVAQARPGPVGRCRLQQRALGQQRAGGDAVGQRDRQPAVTDRQQRPQVTPVGGAQQSAGSDRVHGGSRSRAEGNAPGTLQRQQTRIRGAPGQPDSHGSAAGAEALIRAITAVRAPTVIRRSAPPWALTVSSIRRSGYLPRFEGSSTCTIPPRGDHIDGWVSGGPGQVQAQRATADQVRRLQLQRPEAVPGRGGSPRCPVRVRSVSGSAAG